MIILGVDLGRAKLGLARAESPLAEPYLVIKVTSQKDTLDKVIKEAEKIGAEEIVIGISEGQMAKEQQRFTALLAKKTHLPIRTWDETLSTQDAQSAAIKAGFSRKKRREREDAFAAAIMLQSFLDATVQK